MSAARGQQAWLILVTFDDSGNAASSNVARNPPAVGESDSLLTSLEVALLSAGVLLLGALLLSLLVYFPPAPEAKQRRQLQGLVTDGTTTLTVCLKLGLKKGTSF